MVVSITTIGYVIMICVALYAKPLDLTRYKLAQFVFTVALATEDFISDVLYYYVQVSPCMFESASLSFECTTFATPALFYLSTIALFLPIVFYGIYSGLLRGLRDALVTLSAVFLYSVFLAITWLWAENTDKQLKWPAEYSGLNSHFGKSSACLILLWIMAKSLLLLLTAIAIALGLGLLPTLLVLWLAALVVMLFFGVNTKLFALEGYLNAYNKLLSTYGDLTEEQQNRTETKVESDRRRHQVCSPSTSVCLPRSSVRAFRSSVSCSSTRPLSTRTARWSRQPPPRRPRRAEAMSLACSTQRWPPPMMTWPSASAASRASPSSPS